MNLADQALLRRYHNIKNSGNSTLDIIYQWAKQGVIGNAHQFRMLFGRLVEQEVDRQVQTQTPSEKEVNEPYGEKSYERSFK